MSGVIYILECSGRASRDLDSFLVQDLCPSPTARDPPQVRIHLHWPRMALRCVDAYAVFRKVNQYEQCLLNGVARDALAQTG
jgi:hypothetical protein